MARTCFVTCLIATACITGCGLRDQSTKPVDQTIVVEKPIPDGVTSAKVDQLKTIVETSANSTQNSLSGLVNASISKLAERVVGLEAKIEKVVGLETKIDSLQNNLTASFKASANAELNNRIDRLETQLTANLNASAQANLEINRKMETRLENLNATAGRDVNMLPQAAVDVMISTAQTFAGIIATLCGLASSVVVVMARNSRKRADARALTEREERKQMYELLQQVIKHPNA